MLIARQICIRIRRILLMKSASDGCGFCLAPSHPDREQTFSGLERHPYSQAQLPIPRMDSVAHNYQCHGSDYPQYCNDLYSTGINKQIRASREPTLGYFFNLMMNILKPDSSKLHVRLTHYTCDSFIHTFCCSIASRCASLISSSFCR